MSDPFSLLGLPRRPWLDERTVRTAFQERARSSHPDAEGGNANAFAELNAAQAALAHPASRLRILAGDATIPTMPADIQLGFRVAEIMRKVAGMRDSERFAANVLARVLLAQEAAKLQAELGEIARTLETSRDALDAQLRTFDDRWPNVSATELAELAGECIFLSRWQEQIREARVTMKIAFGKSDGRQEALPPGS